MIFQAILHALMYADAHVYCFLKIKIQLNIIFDLICFLV